MNFRSSNLTRKFVMISALVVGMNSAAYADIVKGAHLNIRVIVKGFNGANRDGNNFFYAFCVEPSAKCAGEMHGLLNDENNMSIPETVRKPMALEAAYLYAHWALGTLAEFNHDDSNATRYGYVSLRGVIQDLVDTPSIAWDYEFEKMLLSIEFEKMLLALIDGKEYWLQSYDSDHGYEEIDCSAFVMNDYDMEGSAQNVVALDSIAHQRVPEPASLAILALGGLALLRRQPVR